MKIRLTVFLVVVVVIVVIVGLASQENKNDEIKIGISLPLTGFLSYLGEDARDSILLAHSLRPSTDGKEIKLIIENDQADSGVSVKIANKFIDLDELKLIISSGSSASISMAPIVEKNDAILISWLATTPKLTEIGDNIFRIASSSERIADTAAKKIIKMNITRVAILYENVEYTTGWKDVFVEKFSELGGVITDVEATEQGAKDVRTQLTKLQEGRPDAIVLIIQSLTSSKSVLQQYEELGIETQAIGSEIFSFDENLQDKTSNRMLVVRYKYSPETEKTQFFLDSFDKEFERTMHNELYGALAYDTYNILVDSIEICGENIECIKKELYSIQNYTGASGTFSIDKNGDALHEFVISRIEDGKLIDI